MQISDRLLEAFITVAEYKLTPLPAIARKMYITPQALGKMIIKLESQLGAKLFVRSSSGFSLTKVGSELFPQTQTLCQRKRSFCRDVQRICENSRGQTCIVVENGLIMSTLSPETAENSVIRYERNLESCFEKVNKGYADLIYGRYNSDLASKLCYIPVIHQDIQVLLHKSHPLAAKDAVLLEDLKNDILLMMPMVTFPDNLTNLCIKSGFMPQYQECMNILTLINLLKQNAGVALFPPALLEECDLADLKYIPIELENKEFQIGFYAREDWRDVAHLNYAIQKTIEYQSLHSPSELFQTPPVTMKGVQKGNKKKSMHDLEFLKISERQIRVFTAICSVGSLKAAAKQLSISEQAASKNLITLEKELGVELFTRKAKSMVPTPVGAELFPLFTQRLEEIDAWYAFVLEICSKPAETIVVAFESRSLFITFPVYRQEEINATINFVACRGLDEGLTLLENGQADMLYCMYQRDMPSHRVIPVLDLVPVVLMNKQHSLAKRETLSVEDLRGEKIAVFESSDPFIRRFQSICHNYGFDPNIITKSYNDSLLIRMVRGNRCIMVLPPNLLSALSMESLVAIPICEPIFTFSTTLIMDQDKELTPAMAQFIQILTNQTEKYKSGYCQSDE